MLLPILIFLIVLMSLFAVKVHRLEKYWRDAGIPYESYLSYLYTNFVRFRRENVYNVLHEYTERYGSIYGTYHALKPLLRVTTIDGAKDALIRNFSSLPRRNLDITTGVPLWDSTIIALPYNHWKIVRQSSGVGFTSNKLRGMSSKLERLSVRLAEKMAQAGRSSGTLDPLEHTRGFALDCIGAIAYGLDLDAMADPDNAFVAHAKDLFAPGLGVFLLTTFPSLLKYTPIGQFPNKKTTDFFHSFTEHIIKQRRQRGLADISKEEYDILDIWLREQENNPTFTDAVIASQTFLFFIAGFETIAYTLYFALHYLAVHPETQERAYAEVKANIRADGSVEFDDINKLKFVEACVLETLRLCPTDFAIDRVCVEPCTIAGVQVTPGTGVQIPVPVIQRDPTYFPDPDSFCPERFLDGSSAVDAFLAFGEGPKNCVGKRLALFELTFALGCVLRKIKLERCSETPETVTFNAGSHFLPYANEPLVIGIIERV